jgi:hypothetical protein
MTDLLDEIDERLTSAARQWQAEQPPPPGVPLDRLDEPLRRTVPWRPAVAAAAAVLVVGGGIAALTSQRHDSPGSLPPADHVTSASTTPPRTCTDSGCAPRARPQVRWRDLPAGHPDVRHRKHGQVVTPFDRISATGTISGDLHPGDVLTFTAVLQSPTRLVLDPCPDFNIAFGRHSWHTWQLNCAQVPFRDGQGRPVLPAFKNVRFAMKVEVPDVRGDQKVLWTLDGPQQMPGFYGIVTVS